MQDVYSLHNRIFIILKWWRLHMSDEIWSRQPNKYDYYCTFIWPPHPYKAVFNKYLKDYFAFKGKKNCYIIILYFHNHVDLSKLNCMYNLVQLYSALPGEVRFNKLEFVRLYQPFEFRGSTPENLLPDIFHYSKSSVFKKKFAMIEVFLLVFCFCFLYD